MNIKTTPVARFGWPGQTLEYTVRADEAAELIAPQECEKGVAVRVLGTRPLGDGVETRIAVDVAEGALY